MSSKQPQKNIENVHSEAKNNFWAIQKHFKNMKFFSIFGPQKWSFLTLKRPFSPCFRGQFLTTISNCQTGNPTNWFNWLVPWVEGLSELSRPNTLWPLTPSHGADKRLCQNPLFDKSVILALLDITQPLRNQEVEVGQFSMLLQTPMGPPMMIL